MTRLKTAMTNYLLDSECDICQYHLISPYLSIGRAAKCFPIHVLCGTCDFINGFISTFNDLFATPKNHSVYFFFPYENQSTPSIPLHIIFPSYGVYLLRYRTKPFSNSEDAHKPGKTAVATDCALCSIPLIIIPGLHLLFLTAISFGIAIFTLFL